MGNRHHHHYSPPQIQYVPDPSVKKLQTQIDYLKEQNKKQLQENRKLNDPQATLQLREKQLQNYLQFLKTKKWTDSLQNTHGVKHNVVVGNISVGKSSLLNQYFDLKLQVGVDQTTMKAQPVRKGKVTIWDSPGVNEDFDLHDAKTLTLFASANKIFVLFNTSLKSSKNEVRILNAIKPTNLYCVRTQIDKFESEDALNQALKKDRQVLEKWSINAPILATSSINKNLRDYQTVKKLMDS